ATALKEFSSGFRLTIAITTRPARELPRALSVNSCAQSAVAPFKEGLARGVLWSRTSSRLIDVTSAKGVLADDTAGSRPDERVVPRPRRHTAGDRGDAGVGRRSARPAAIAGKPALAA